MGQNDPFQRMSPTQARSGMQKIADESHELSTDTLITLYEIDISEIKKNMNLNSSELIEGDILAFHNMEVLRGKKIFFDSKTYFAMPIHMEGFEMTSSGELPRPIMMMTSMKGIRELEEADPNNYVWKALKTSIINLDNLTGAKVTRIRTFAKYLDATNEIIGAATAPDPYAQFPREVYYVDSKTREDKDSLQFELSSFQDIENFKLPGRFVLASRCPFIYRGDGCAYEFKASTGPDQTKQKEIFGDYTHLPDYAPPIATEDDKTISSEISSYNPDNVTAGSVTEYNPALTYSVGSVVYIEKNDIKYYFVSKGLSNGQPVGAYTPPPNVEYWVADRCSKTIGGCKKRYGSSGSAKNIQGAGKTYNNKFLNFGGFPGTNTRISV